MLVADLTAWFLGREEEDHPSRGPSQDASLRLQSQDVVVEGAVGFARRNKQSRESIRE